VVAVSVIYETHSLTSDNDAGRATGWLPGTLSREGRVLAAERGGRRRTDNITAVFTSDLQRAVETAEIAFAGTNIPQLKDWRLCECNYGVLDGAPLAEVAGRRLGCIAQPFPGGGQSYRDVVENMASFLADVVRQFDGQRICVVSHSANKWALDVLLLGKRLEDLVCADFGWCEGWEYLVT
jgi:alpha-ribazole phosphatase/probable phosphoglycerate mutase